MTRGGSSMDSPRKGGTCRFLLETYGHLDAAGTGSQLANIIFI